MGWRSLRLARALSCLLLKYRIHILRSSAYRFKLYFARPSETRRISFSCCRNICQWLPCPWSALGRTVSSGYSTYLRGTSYTNHRPFRQQRWSSESSYYLVLERHLSIFQCRNGRILLSVARLLVDGNWLRGRTCAGQTSCHL